jgi:hypothetical protein
MEAYRLAETGFAGAFFTAAEFLTTVFFAADFLAAAFGPADFLSAVPLFKAFFFEALSLVTRW